MSNNLQNHMKNTETKYPSFIDVRYAWQELKKSSDGYTNSHLYIKNTESKGLGVFTTKDIKNGEVIEYCHCLPIETPRQWMNDKGIKKYSYWHRDSGLIALGFGSIYNSAEREHLRNAGYFLFPEDQLLVFVAQKDIGKNEEIVTWWGEGFYRYWCDPTKKD